MFRALITTATIALLTTVHIQTANGLDAETQQLETQALCAAMPYRCPGFVSTPAPAPTTPDPTDVHVLCASLEHPKDPGTQAAVEAEKRWQQSCLPWYAEQKKLRAKNGTLDLAYKGNPSAPPPLEWSWPRAVVSSPPSRSTIDCYTTSYHGYYSSRLTTTCTSY